MLPYCTLVWVFLILKRPTGLLNILWLVMVISYFARIHKPAPIPHPFVVIRPPVHAA
jgi:hypothetical protein